MGGRVNGRTRTWIGVMVVMLCCTVGSPASAPAASPPVLTGSVSDSSDLSSVSSVAVASPQAGRTYAYATAYHTGQLTAIDVSTPASPIVVGSSPATSSLLNGSNVALAGGYAYVVSKNHNLGAISNDDGTGNGLTILDVHTDPTHPTIVGVVQDPVRLFGAYGIAIRGRYAYIAAQGCIKGEPCLNPGVGNSFVVVDISDPASPTIVADVQDSSLLDHVTAVAISGHYAYLTASYANRLTVLDISNPLAPQIVASVQDPRLRFDVDVAVQGDYAYVADQSTVGMTIVDISNPLSPRITGASNSPWLNGGYRIRVRGALAYVSAAYAESVSSVDISDPTAPRVAGAIYNPVDLDSTTGLDLDPASHDVIATSPRQPGQTGLLTGTVSVIALDPSPITVAIRAASLPPNPTTQATASFSLVTNDQVFTPRCQIDGAPATLCTSFSTQRYSSLGLGSHVFTVEAFDSAGTLATATYRWRIGTAPQISRFRQSRSRWRHRVGTRFSFDLNEAASVKFVFTHSVPGREVGGKCAGLNQQDAHASRCRRTVTAEAATLAERVGADRVSFQGTRLSPGGYTVVVMADAAGLFSSPETLHFTILRG